VRSKLTVKMNSRCWNRP